MPSSELRVSVEAIRRAVQVVCGAASLRSVARDVGMTPMGLSAFLKGAKPQERTLRKLLVWYASHSETEREDGETEVRAGLALLAMQYPAPDRLRIELRMLNEMEEAFREIGMKPPAWLESLRAESARRTV